MLNLQVLFNQQEGWLTIERVDTLDFGLYRIAYFFEHYEDNHYRVANETEKPISFGKKRAVCMLCRQQKMLALEFNQCHTCLEKLNDNYIRT